MSQKKRPLELDKLELAYVASLTPTHHKDLLNIAVSDYRSVKVGEHNLFAFLQYRADCVKMKKVTNLPANDKITVVFVRRKLYSAAGLLGGSCSSKQKALYPAKLSVLFSELPEYAGT